ncbi:MAG TPA: phage holin family protein [Candidatus Paceibacterota bacterium]|nr:phage holin family protein [Candidatus Paceibacterota bacterium]
MGTLVRKTLGTAIGALQNRGELMMVEWQQEKSRLIQLVILGIGALFLAMMSVLLITGAVIFLVPEEYRLFAVGAFAALYLGGTLWAVFSLKSALKKIPFGDTIAELKKDGELMEAFNE